ncbi:MAG: hypothetical protein V1735_01705 [Nanoarchaeota archaeon]
MAEPLEAEFEVIDEPPGRAGLSEEQLKVLFHLVQNWLSNKVPEVHPYQIIRSAHAGDADAAKILAEAIRQVSKKVESEPKIVQTALVPYQPPRQETKIMPFQSQQVQPATPRFQTQPVFDPNILTAFLTFLQRRLESDERFRGELMPLLKVALGHIQHQMPSHTLEPEVLGREDEMRFLQGEGRRFETGLQRGLFAQNRIAEMRQQEFEGHLMAFLGRQNAKGNIPQRELLQQMATGPRHLALPPGREEKVLKQEEQVVQQEAKNLKEESRRRKLARGVDKGAEVGGKVALGTAKAVGQTAAFAVKAPFKLTEYAARSDFSEVVKPTLRTVFWISLAYHFFKLVMWNNMHDSTWLFNFSLMYSSMMFYLVIVLVVGQDKENVFSGFVTSLPVLICINIILTVIVKGVQGLSISIFAVALLVSLTANYFRKVTFEQYRERFGAAALIGLIALLDSGLLIRIEQILNMLLPNVELGFLYRFMDPAHELFWILPWWSLWSLYYVRGSLFRGALVFRTAHAMAVVLILTFTTAFWGPAMVAGSFNSLLGNNAFAMTPTYGSDETPESTGPSTWNLFWKCAAGSMKGDTDSCYELTAPKKTADEEQRELEGGLVANKEQSVKVAWDLPPQQTVYAHDVEVSSSATVTALTLDKPLMVALSCGLAKKQKGEIDDPFLTVPATGTISPKSVSVDKNDRAGEMKTVSCSIKPESLEPPTEKIVYTASFGNTVNSYLDQWFMDKEQLKEAENKALNDTKVASAYFAMLSDPARRAKARATLQHVIFSTQLGSGAFESKSDVDFIKLIIETERQPVIGLDKSTSVSIKVGLENRNGAGKITKLTGGTLEIPSWLELTEPRLCPMLIQKQPGKYDLNTGSLAKRDVADVHGTDQLVVFACSFSPVETFDLFQENVPDNMQGQWLYSYLKNELYPERISASLGYEYEVNAMAFLSVLPAVLGEIDEEEKAEPNPNRGDLDTQQLILQRLRNYQGSTELEHKKPPEALLLALALERSGGFIDNPESKPGATKFGIFRLPSLSCDKGPEALAKAEENIDCYISLLIENYEQYQNGADPKKCGYGKYEGWYAVVRNDGGWECTDKAYVERVVKKQDYFNGVAVT